MRLDELVIDFLLLPAFIVGMCGLILASAYQDGFGRADVIFTVFYFLILLASGYQIFYKKYYKAGRTKYFYALFVVPTVITALLYVIGLVRSSTLA